MSFDQMVTRIYLAMLLTIACFGIELIITLVTHNFQYKNSVISQQQINFLSLTEVDFRVARPQFRVLIFQQQHTSLINRENCG